MMADSRNYLMVAAIDFGTTYSGYSFSMRNEFAKDPLQIHTAMWKTRHCTSVKTPTCLLLDGKREFVAFGYDAENQWAELLLEEEHADYLYFERFKMNLHNNKNITSSMMLEDITGTKRMPAFDVFKLSIKFLVTHLLDLLKTRGNIVQQDEVQWVLTVPAIWTDKAKRFMRSCAEAAGIQTKNLIVALEPETASIFCQYLPTERLNGSVPGFAMTSEGTEYMVVDLGGGTADITVHQKVANGRLKEIHRAMGNDCGGTSVDRRFFDLCEKIFGDKIMKSLKEESPLAYLDLVREFEIVKKTLETKKPKVTITIPFVALNTMCQEVHKKDLQSVLKSSSYSEEIKLTHDKIRMSLEFFKDLYIPSINNVITLMKEILGEKTLKGVTHLLLVGGFSDCQFIKDAVNTEFPEKRIIIPEEASLSVLRGAVLFGHKPEYIQSRIMRCSYGVKTNVPWDNRKYDEKHYVVMEKEERCDNIFSLIVGKDDSVEAGMLVKKSFFTPFKHQDKMDIMVYVSEEATPGYIDERCSLLCTPTITFSDTCEDQRWVDVEFVLGNTEIDLKAHDRMSGEAISAKFNLI
ncbi:heat shock 70 kDa protein 12B-like [Mytilus edulis]|uniref:heat shock 70 kDa protein 12B-like n=1 Tax=Mytilus edulis TaxID=6550 RepID=UPI0039EE4B51